MNLGRPEERRNVGEEQRRNVGGDRESRRRAVGRLCLSLGLILGNLSAGVTDEVRHGKLRGGRYGKA
jgi:hypothetical protein